MMKRLEIRNKGRNKIEVRNEDEDALTVIIIKYDDNDSSLCSWV